MKITCSINIFKRLLTALLALSIIFLSSCSMISQMILSSKLEDQGYYTEYKLDGKFEDLYSDQSENKLLGLLSQMEDLTEENDQQEGPRLLELYKQLESLLYVILDHKNFVYIQFCKQPSKNEFFEEYNRLSSFCTDAISRIYVLYGEIYSGNLSSAFFEEWDEESIAKALYLSKTYSGEFAKITKERDELIALYEQLNRNSLSFNSKSAEYYRQIVSKNRILADLADYDSYPAYADAYIYERDYSATQIEAFKTYVKDYIVPLANELYDFVRKNTGTTAQTQLSMLKSYDMSFSLMEEKLTPYYQLLGEEFSKGFTAFTESVFTAYNKNSSPAAFTVYQQSNQQSLCYFGEGYQNIATYVHEQGHYLSFYFSKSSIFSVDLCETHSQSNEWLYLAYLEQFYDSEIYKEITAYYLLYDLISMLLAVCCDSFERAVYEDPSLKADDYDDLFISCSKELGAYSLLKSYMGSNLTDYWRHAVISTPMYYLSYAVSLIPSLEFFLIAEEAGMEQTASYFKELCTADSNSAFLESVLGASLCSPFEEDVYQKIYDRFRVS